MQCSVLQLLGTGFFHSDPHRGNLLRTLDNKLCYLDFGMMATVSSAKRYAMIGTVLGLVNKDVPLATNSLSQLNFFTPQTNITNVISALNLAILNSTETGKVSSLNFSRLSVNINRIQDQLTMQLPPYYLMIIRSLSVLEGLALNVDKDFKLIRGAYPFILRQILTSPQLEMTSLLEKVLLTSDGRINWSKLEQLLLTSSRANQAMQGNFTALNATQGQSDMLKNYQASPDANSAQNNNRHKVEVTTLVINFLFSESGKLLREPLIEEIADTLEALQLNTQAVLSLVPNQVIPSPSTKRNREKIMRAVRLLGVLAE
ncbi:AarF/ABC1/UbiB kinase family protein, partial [archaeon]